jgi:hypothetical protein
VIGPSGVEGTPGRQRLRDDRARPGSRPPGTDQGYLQLAHRRDAGPARRFCLETRARDAGDAPLIRSIPTAHLWYSAGRPGGAPRTERLDVPPVSLGIAGTEHSPGLIRAATRWASSTAEESCAGSWLPEETRVHEADPLPRAKDRAEDAAAGCPSMAPRRLRAEPPTARPTSATTEALTSLPWSRQTRARRRPGPRETLPDGATHDLGLIGEGAFRRLRAYDPRPARGRAQAPARTVEGLSRSRSVKACVGGAHPNIVTVFADVRRPHRSDGAAGGGLGPSGLLRGRLGRGRRSPARPCRALAAPTRVDDHRDIKAQNVMRTREGRSCHGPRAGATDRDDRQRAGSAIYMAPECLAGELCRRFSTLRRRGVLFYLLTGEFSHRDSLKRCGLPPRRPASICLTSVRFPARP